MNSSPFPTSYGLDAVNVSFLSINDDNNDDDNGGPSKLPLLISPRWETSLAFLVEWLRVNRSWMDDMMLRHGAILVRGFDVHTPNDMESAVKTYQPHLNDTYRGTSPRRLMEDTQYVFSAAEVPANYPIAQHLEMSFLNAPPKQLFFGCIKPSKSAGGETALADFRSVFRDISPELKQKFLDKGICYTRTHKKVGTYFTYDVADMLSWPELFGTNDKAVVEEMCRAENIPVEWAGPNGDTFISKTWSPAFQLHPITKEHVWFNHTQVFHWTTFPAELWFAYCRTGDWRLFVHFVLVTLFCVIKYGLLRHKMSLHATFGDDEPISVPEMTEIRSAIHKNMIFSRWRKGDILFLDNFSISHGRQPTYDKGRKVVVAWGEPLTKANEVTSLSPSVAVPTAVASSTIKSELLVEDEPFQACGENPQERTPPSTLTKSESKALIDTMKNEIHLEQELRHRFVTKTSSVEGHSENPQGMPLTADETTIQQLKTIVARTEARQQHNMHHRHTSSGALSVLGNSDFWQLDD